MLEYCDHGCLRDAIDGGAFLLPGGLNYAAVLDTAADVAKAMLHLHCNQVIHSDLKVRCGTAWQLCWAVGVRGRGGAAARGV